MARYPEIYTAQRITAGLLQSMLPQFALKPSDTNRASTTTLADDPDLQIELEANATYRVEFYIGYSSLAVAGFKTAWTTPSGATGLRSCWGAGTSPTSTTLPTGDGRWGIHGMTTAAEYGTRNSTNQAMAWETGEVTTTSAGTLALQWAQVTSDASETRVAARSYLRVERLA
ncbi:hypothetical protein ABZ690_11945 [Streptomyces sp. NPDC006967]|uniref:hypothetical protein n=1 Tax=Streptomyces sp. NPDC006967 TaxID=3156906 RepID=UPI0033EA71D3